MLKQFSFILILLSGSVTFSMELPKNEQNTIIFSHEADDYLERSEHSNLKNSLSEFIKKNGTIIRMAGETAPFKLEVGDVIFPSCSGGNNRSQTLWGLLQVYRNAISLQSPHATRYGFDPYNGGIDWQHIKHIQKNDEFVQWAGQSKSIKFGWNFFKDWLLKNEVTTNDLALMTEYYDMHYFNPNLPLGTRRIYISFAKNAHVHLYRLIQSNVSLDNVIVLFYPVEDLIASPLPEWETYPRSVQAYIQLASMIEKYLDFSQLKFTKS